MLSEDGGTKCAAIVLSNIDSSMTSPVKILSVASRSECGSVTVLSDSSIEASPKEEPITTLVEGLIALPNEELIEISHDSAIVLSNTDSTCSSAS